MSFGFSLQEGFSLQNQRVCCVSCFQGSGRYAIYIANYASGNVGPHALIEMDESASDLSQGVIALSNVAEDAGVNKFTGKCETLTWRRGVCARPCSPFPPAKWGMVLFSNISRAALAHNKSFTAEMQVLRSLFILLRKLKGCPFRLIYSRNCTKIQTCVSSGLSCTQPSFT